MDFILDQVFLPEVISIHEEVDEEVEEDDGKRGRDVRPFFLILLLVFDDSSFLIGGE